MANSIEISKLELIKSIVHCTKTVASSCGMDAYGYKYKIDQEKERELL